MHDALKSFYYCKKNAMQKKKILFISSDCHGNAFFMKILSANLYESQFRRFCDKNIMYLSFKFFFSKS